MKDNELNLTDFELDFDLEQFNKEEIKDKKIEEKEEEAIEKEEIIEKEVEDLDTSEDERLVNLWVDKKYLMINPEEDEISSLDEALELDAKRRTEYIATKVKEDLIENFPEEFKILADAVLNHKVTDVKKLLTFYDSDIKEEEMNEKSAKSILAEHYKEIGYDQEEIDYHVESLSEKGKLISAASKIQERNLEAEKKIRQAEIQANIEKEKAIKKEEEQRNQMIFEALQEEFNNKPWETDTKKKLYNEYMTGITIDKAQALLQDPKTAADFAMLIAKIYQQDDKGRVSININPFIKQIKTEKNTEIKKSLEQEKSTRIRFNTTKKQNDEFNLSDYEF